MQARSPDLELVPRVTTLLSPEPEYEGSWCSLERDGRELSVGRAGGLILHDARASRIHLTIRVRKDGALRISDADSRNGTRVGGHLLDAPLHVWSDAIVQAGDTLLHVGYVLPRQSSSQNDQLIDAAARRLADAPQIVQIWSAPGMGIELLARQIHARRRTTGSLYCVGDDTGTSAIAQRVGPDDTVLAPRTALDGLADTGARLLIRVSRPAEADVVLPPLETRRAELWRVTRALVLQRIGIIPSFSARALGIWLQAEWPDGWRSVEQAVAKLCATLGHDTEIKSQHVADVLGVALPRSQKPASPRMVPTELDRDSLEQMLRQLGSVAAVAAHYRRSPRQVYRWLERFGMQAPRHI
ncbi:MAG: hypothetical protein ACI9OJ_005342 [Myxococcota bacterium]|jgi:hypothetical protein